MVSNTEYWTNHTVATRDFKTREESLDHIRWRNGLCLFRENLMPVVGHDGKDILDHGCGTGNNLVNLLEFSKPKSLVGVDISPTGVALSRARAALHDDRKVCRVDQVIDGEPRLPFDDASFDLIISEGVVHHAPNPEELLAEFKRILRPGGEVKFYIYNYNSIWLHYYVAYHKRVVDGAYKGLSIREAHRHCVDGEDCPIANCYTPEEFVQLAANSGLPETRFVGAGVLFNELGWVQNRHMAIASDVLELEHRTFLRSLTFDQHGLPMINGVHAGHAGFYSYIKP